MCLCLLWAVSTSEDSPAALPVVACSKTCALLCNVYNNATLRVLIPWQITKSENACQSLVIEFMEASLKMRANVVFEYIGIRMMFSL